MIELHQFTPAFGLMNASPFCMKVEVFLKLAGLEYRCVNGAMPMGKPKGKLPVLHDDAQVIADSQAIVEHLQRRYADRLAPALRAPMTGAHHALRRMLEESTYFCALWLRWIDDEGWRATGPAFFGAMPAPLRGVVPLTWAKPAITAGVTKSRVSTSDRPSSRPWCTWARSSREPR